MCFEILLDFRGYESGTFLEMGFGLGMPRSCFTDHLQLDLHRLGGEVISSIGLIADTFSRTVAVLAGYVNGDFANFAWELTVCSYLVEVFWQPLADKLDARDPSG